MQIHGPIHPGPRLLHQPLPPRPPRYAQPPSPSLPPKPANHGAPVGPAAPSTHALDPTTRFPPTLFALPRPQYANPTTLSAERLAAVLGGGKQKESGSGGAEQLRRLKAEAAAPLPGSRPYVKGVGFFEQGLLLGFGMVGVPVLAGVGAVAWFGGRGVVGWLRG